MTPRPRKGPYLYTRQRGGQLRYYADLRSVGGGRVPLKAAGEAFATTDPVIAQHLFAELLRSIHLEKRDASLLGVRRRATLYGYAAEHLSHKKNSGRFTDDHLALSQVHLEAAIAHFGADRAVDTIGVEDVQAFANHLAELPNGRGGTLAPGTQRKYLNALSNLFRRAQGEGVIRGANPVAALMDKPQGAPGEAAWLEVWEAALLLEAARTFPYDPPETSTAGERLALALRSAIAPGEDAEAAFLEGMRAAGMVATRESLRAYLSGQRIPTKRYVEVAEGVLQLKPGDLHRGRGWTGGARPSPLAYPIIAAFLLTGGRESEVLGLELRDVNLRHGVVHFRPTDRRRLKTSTSRRSVPLWPQLRDILTPHLEARRREGAAPNDLVFPSARTGGMITDLRKSLDAIAGLAGWGAGEVRTKAFRHAYCAARLQTLDRGHPVSIYTVSRELGHGGESMVKRVYGHLGQVRHRSEEVEYRLEQQRAEIPPERLRRLLRAV